MPETSPSSGASAKEILEKLSTDAEATAESDAAVVEAEESTTVETEAEKPRSEGRRKNYIPEDRFKEVIEDKNYYKKQLELATEREQQMQTQLQKLEQELSVLERIRQAAFDDKVGQHVIALDKWLKGEPLEEAVESANQEVEEKEGGLSAKELDVLKKQLGSKVSELESELQEQRAEVILDRANNIASRMLQGLDDSYAEEDVRTISELWTHKVDWDSIEENPEILEEELNRSFKEVLDLYGVPKGKLLESGRSDTSNSERTQTLEDDPETFLSKVVNTDWGKLNEKGKPVVSDDEFSKVMAEVLRKSRGLE